MSDLITVQGVVLSSMPVGEYDKRIVLLTRERGKISAFAKGARRPNNPFMAAASPFVFGSFSLYEGRSSYNLNHAEITHHFTELAALQPGIYYGYYFLELLDYFGREGLDQTQEMNLLYVTVKALLNPSIDDRLIRCVFELRLLVTEGLMPEMEQCMSCGCDVTEESTVWFSLRENGILCGRCHENDPQAVRISAQTLYAMRWIAAVPLGKLYTFTLKEEYLQELWSVVVPYTGKNTDRPLKSLEILEMMVS